MRCDCSTRQSSQYGNHSPGTVDKDGNVFCESCGNKI